MAAAVSQPLAAVAAAAEPEPAMEIMPAVAATSHKALPTHAYVELP